MPKVYNSHHCNAPADAVYIGRGSPYGNPFHIGKDGDRDEVCDKYEAMVEADQEKKARFVASLRDKDLVCFCSPLRCHGDYLLRIVNAPMVEEAVEVPHAITKQMSNYIATAERMVQVTKPKSRRIRHGQAGTIDEVG